MAKKAGGKRPEVKRTLAQGIAKSLGAKRPAKGMAAGKGSSGRG